MSEPSSTPNDGSPLEWRYYTRRLRRHPMLRAWRRSSQGVKHFLPSMWRLATHDSRQLPSVVIAGAQKAGTTQLFAYLIKHPRLFPGCSKEIDYFSRYAERPLRWYQSRFPLRRSVAAVEGHVIDASPSYMCTPAAIHKMSGILPNAKVIVVLRDPVSRAFSSYQHSKTRHRDTRTFDDAVADELRENRYRPQLGTALAADITPLREYVARGYYALQLELILKLYSRDRVLVLDSRELFADTNATCQRVFDFVGVENFDVQPEKIYNRGFYTEKISPQMAELLREHYRPHDELLAQLLGVRPSWMTDTAPRAAA